MNSGSTSNAQFLEFSSQIPLTPEQQAILQTQQQAFVEFQQNFQNQQQNPPQLPIPQQQSQSLHQLVSEPKFLIKMPPRRNKDINDVYNRIMARMEERLDQFVDQFVDRMYDMINPKRRGDRDGRRGEGEELEYPFFEGGGSSFDEWGGYGVADDDYEEAPVFDDDQSEDELEMGDDVFVLIGKEVTPDSKIPKAMFPLLEEFSDVFPDELPDGLPPLRDIQNNIDLQPGS
ncbi:hypothetical protein Tco_0973865 [Tanacetum coccineum]|uniref:Reverse transcriptase domain-containing protein n=1 Tax=Tanacetum coccineum TaxID=301880 RepID=A0ABQ5EA77_9ASTR